MVPAARTDPARPRGPRLRRLPTPTTAIALVALAALVALWTARAYGWLSPSLGVDLVLGLVLAGAALRRAGLEARALGLVLAGIALYALYLGYTGATERNYDAGPHLMYVRFVADHLALPAKAACNVCHHPPAYYVVAAALYRVLGLAHAAEPALGLQILALVMVSSFAACAALTLQQLLPPGAPRLVATALVVFWPYQIIDAARVGNDAMLYAIAGGVMLALARWRPARGDAPLWIAATLVVLGFFTKANAIALAALLFLAMARAIVHTPRRRARAFRLAPAAALVLVGGLVQRLARRSAAGDGSLEGVLGNAQNAFAGSLAPRTAHEYLSFDLQSFVQVPYATVSLRGAAEAPFWNQLLKSSLLGTRRSLLGAVMTSEPAQLARALNVLLLAMLLVLLAGQLRSIRAPSPTRAFALVAALIFGGVAVGFHLLVPFGFHADFRFIHPVLVPMAWLYVDGAIRLGADARALRLASFGLAAAFVATSIAYFVPATWQSPPARTPVTIGDLAAAASAAPTSSAAPKLRLPRAMTR
jgi:hypothetical protein